MSRLNRPLLIALGAGVLVVVFWYLVLWGPQSSSLSKSKKRTEEAVAKRDQLQSQLQRLQAARQDLPIKQAQLETLRVAIPDDPNLAQFILDANDAAAKSGIDFLSITPTPPTTGATTATTAPGAAAGAGGAAATTPVPIRIGMNISGGYFQVLDFINQLNKLPRIVVVDSLNVSSGSGSASGTGATGTAAAAGTTQTASGQLTVTLSERIFTTSERPVSATTSTTAAPGATTTTVAGGAATTTTAAGR